MEKKWVTEEMREHEAWYADAQQVVDTKDLSSLIDRLMNDYSHDVETVVHAMAAGALATLKLMNSYPEGDINVAQKHKLLGHFVRRFANMQGPITLIQWLGLLNPSNSSLFNTVPRGVWAEIQAGAADLLAQDQALREIDTSLMSQQEKLEHQKSLLAQEQVEHLKSIQSGHVPWGLKLQQ